METIDDLIRTHQEPADFQPIAWNRDNWQQLWDAAPAIPALEVLDLIDAEVQGAGQGTIRRSWIRGLADGDDALVFLAASTIWGYGNYVRFGRPALRAMLSTPDAPSITRDIIERSRLSPAGFSALFADGRPRIAHLSIAFGTKVVHFAGYDVAAPKPLILDKRVYRSAQRLGVDAVPDPEGFVTGVQYEGYCTWAAEVAASHGVEPAIVEYALFATGSSR